MFLTTGTVGSTSIAAACSAWPPVQAAQPSAGCPAGSVSKTTQVLSVEGKKRDWPVAAAVQRTNVEQDNKSDRMIAISNVPAVQTNADDSALQSLQCSIVSLEQTAPHAWLGWTRVAAWKLQPNSKVSSIRCFCIVLRTVKTCGTLQLRCQSLLGGLILIFSRTKTQLELSGRFCRGRAPCRCKCHDS